MNSQWLAMSEHSRELVDSDDDLQPKLARVLNMLHQVLASFFQRTQILLGVRIMQRFTGCNIGSTTMHLQSASGRYNDDSIGLETTDTTLDVAELLHAHVSTETTFREDVSNAIGLITFFDTCKFECYTISEDGRVAVRDVGEWTCMHEDGSTLVK